MNKQVEIEWIDVGGHIVPGLGMPNKGDRFSVSPECAAELIRDNRAKAVRSRVVRETKEQED